MDRLKGKVAIVTGAGTGVGRACMKLFASEGAKVVGVSRTQANLDETLKEVEVGGGEGRVVAADLSKPEGADKVVAETLKAYGRIDILVNSAGVGYSWLEKSPGSMGSVTDTTPEKWREVMAIQKRISRELNKKLVGKHLDVLIEGSHPESADLLVGRHEGQAPDIDGQVIINEGMGYPGEIVTVEITEAHDYDLIGRVIERPDPKKRPHAPREAATSIQLPVIGAPR